jgi:hypothetical protein
LPDSPFYIPETQAPSSSVIVLRPKVSWSETAFSLLRRAKPRLWQFCPYSMACACQTVPAVLDLLTLP